MRTKLRSKISLLFVAFAVMLAVPAVALADQLHNDVVAGVGGKVETITAGGSTSVDYWITSEPAVHDGQGGCNAADGSKAIVTINAPAGVTATPSSLEFNACSANDKQAVSFSSNTPGTYNITASVTDSGTGSYSTNHAAFTLQVNPAASADNTAPVLSLPADMTVEATGPSGAVVNYNASANDAVDGPVTVNCSPSSGSTFPLGQTTVNCSATDATGNTANGSFNVTVEDTTPPTISNVPADISTTATSSLGAVVNYTNPTASDLVDGNVAVNCLPASGSQFPLGQSTVNCSATDAAGNGAQASFKVNVTYSLAGILQPINGGLTLGVHGDDNSAFKQGSTVPVKFQFSGASAGITDAIANLKITKVSNGVLDSVELEAGTSTAASSGSLFRYDATSDQYIYNWGTKGYAAGTYQLRVDLGDGNGSHTVWISLKK